MASDAPKSPYSGLAALLAGGYASVTAVLGFLGVKDDAVGRLLREEPRAILLFGALIAAGIVLGAVAQQLLLPGSVPVLLLSVVCVAPVLLFHVVANAARSQDVTGEGANLLIILISSTLFFLLVAVLFGSKRMPMNGALLAVGGVCFALGTYGAVRLATDTASSFSTAQITAASIVHPDKERLQLEATVSASGLRSCQQLEVEVNDHEVANALAGADGKVTVTIDSAVDAAWLSGGTGEGDQDNSSVTGAELVLTGRVVEREGVTCETDIPDPAPVAERVLPIPGPSAPVLKPSFGADRTLTVGVVTTDQPSNGFVAVAIYRTDTANACKRVLASALVPVDSRGSLDTQLVARIGPAARSVSVSAEFRATGGESGEVSCEHLPTDAILQLAVPGAPAASGGGTSG